MLSTALAAPLAREEPPAGAAGPISLPPRPSLTNSDGIFDIAAASILNRRMLAKHRQNLLVLQENSGGSLPEGMKIPEPDSGSQDQADEDKLGENNLKLVNQVFRTKKGEEGLTDEENETEWAGNFEIGTPGQKFLADFDTGSSDLWVEKYDPEKSKTSKKKDGTFSIEYGDGSTASGPIYSDTVTIAGVAVVNQTFSGVNNVTGNLITDPVMRRGGILGLAWQELSNLKARPWFLRAVDQNDVKNKKFGYHASSDKGSELFFGGTNTDLYQGSLEEHKVDHSQGFWKLKDAGIDVGGHEAMKDFETIIDSGTTLMYGPPQAVKEFYTHVDGAKLYDQKQGFYSFPCDKVPKVSFSWNGGQKFPISAKTFNLGKPESGSSSCIGSILASDLELGKNVWLIGDTFLQNVYAGFDFGNHDKHATVGFAKLKNGS
ncbi:acid protease [Lentinula aciculospora]|uniref:Acid protease n=1 Tax=Lentinula aciculospora TaxID=153920 RepID=A0A9W9APR7_9AGAR|nr:acid protease [Lentinula aciculospora]